MGHRPARLLHKEILNLIRVFFLDDYERGRRVEECDPENEKKSGGSRTCRIRVGGTGEMNSGGIRKGEKTTSGVKLIYPVTFIFFLKFKHLIFTVCNRTIIKFKK